MYPQSSMTHFRVRPTEKPWHSVWLDKECDFLRITIALFPTYVPRHLIFLLKPWAVSVFWETWAILSLGTRYILLYPCKLQWSPFGASFVWHHDIGGTQLARSGGRLLCSCYHKLGTPCLLAMFKQIASNNRNVSMKPEEKSNYLYKVIPHQACQFTCYKTI